MTTMTAAVTMVLLERRRRTAGRGHLLPLCMRMHLLLLLLR